MKIAIIGSGSWGTALACVAGEGGADVVLWGRDASTAAEINSRRTSEVYLPGVELPSTFRATIDFADCAGADIALFVVPSGVLDRVAARAAEEAGLDSGCLLVSCAKGIEKESGRRMSQIIAGHFASHRVAVLSGPNHAEEIARKLAAAAVIGCEDHEVAVRLQTVFNLPWFRFYTSEDTAGIEWAGAVKNVFAIAAGIADGLGLGDNAKAALVTRGLAEMVRIGVAHGGRRQTFQGLSGVGDLIATCYSSHSRNNRLGRRLGTGMPLAEAVASMKMVAEGVPNTESIYLAARRVDVRTPLIDAVYAVLYEHKPTVEALQELLARDPRPEDEDE